MRNYPVQASAAEMIALRDALEASDILRERRGRNCGGPSGATHRSVRLRPVIERLCLRTGDIWHYTFSDGDGKPESKEHHQSLVDAGNFFKGEFYLFTLTEEEYDHEQYQREA